MVCKRAMCASVCSELSRPSQQASRSTPYMLNYCSGCRLPQSSQLTIDSGRLAGPDELVTSEECHRVICIYYQLSWRMIDGRPRVEIAALTCT